MRYLPDFALQALHRLDRRYLRRRLYLAYHANPSGYRRIQQMTQNPIVIGGCGRSGTTLLLSVLSCHPHILALPDETQALCPTAYSREPNPAADFRLEFVIDALLAEGLPESATRWCEKTPRNVHYIGRILDYLGRGVRFINLVRDGRDVITSVHPDKRNEYWVSPDRWLEDVAAALPYEDHPQVLTVRYENLTGDYERCVRRICSFVGEVFHDNFHGYPKTATVRSSNAWFSPAQAIHRRSIRRWEDDTHKSRIGTFLSTPKAVELLRHYGYM